MSSIPLVQNFSLPAGDAMEIHFDVSPDDLDPLPLGSNIVWNLYKQEHGIITDDTPIVSKALDAGLQIDDSVTWKFTVTLDSADTVGLSGNYRHSSKVTIAGKPVTIVSGIGTVTEGR